MGLNMLLGLAKPLCLQYCCKTLTVHRLKSFYKPTHHPCFGVRDLLGHRYLFRSPDMQKWLVKVHVQRYEG